MTGSCKSLEVFDFKEEDELTELASSKLATKFKDPSALDKYKFLEHVAQDTNFQAKEMGNIPCVDVDQIDNDQNCENALPHIPFGREGEDPATKQLCGMNDVVLFNSTSHEQHTQFIPDKFEAGSFSAQLESEASKAGAASPGNKQLNCAHQESPSSNEPVDVNLDVDECMSESSSSMSPDSPGDDVPLDGHGLLSDHCFHNWEMGDRNMAVVCPDYTIYRGRYCTGCVLIFSRNCVELKGSTAFIDQETFSFQWGIDDIIHIESQWFERLETAGVKIRLMSKDAMQAENVHGTGIEELQFAINDFNWVEKQEEIMSLDVKYKALWNVLSTDIGGDGEALPGQDRACFPRRRYFPDFDEPFEEVIYPKGDSDAVSISKRDVDLLQPDTFVNDTIIDFYIKYLKNELQPDKRHRFHFFNSFFFRKLIDLDKDQSSAFESRAAFQRVRKWTRKVNLFEKDYIFIPVNFNYHWSLIVICHPGEIAKFQDEDLETTRKVPCILHMDSIKGTHTGLKNPVQSYLLEEWKEKQKEGSEDISSKFFNLRFVPLELPQQQNSFDCGLFLLHYVELFLEEAPLNFTPFSITKFSSFLNLDWFPPAEPSFKRFHIQKLICKIVERENSPAASCGEPCASNHPTSNNEIETGVVFISEGCGTLKSSHENVTSSQAGQGIEITLLPKASQCGGDSDLAFREYIEAGVPAGSFLDGQYQTFERAASFSEFKPIEDVEAGEQFVYPPSNRTGFQQLAGIGPGTFVFPYQSKDFEAETSWNQGIHQPEHEDIDASPETSICASDGSLEVAVTEKSLVGEDVGAEEKIDRPRSPSAENIEFLTENLSAPSEILDVADSQSDHILDSNGNADHPISPRILRRLSDQVCDKQENVKVKCDDVHFIGNNTLSESDGQQVLERTGDDSVPEPDGQQVLGRTGDNSMSEPDGQQILGRIGDDSVSEPDGQQNLGRSVDDSVSEPDGPQILGRIGDDSVSEPDGPQILGRTGDDSVSEPDGQQILGRTGDDSVSEPDGQRVLGRSGDDSVLEPDGQRVLEMNGDDSIPESDGQQILGRTGDDSVLEPDGQQVLEMKRDDSVPESDGQPATEMIGGDLVPEADGQETAKRVCNDSLSESDELQPAKRLRLTLPLEGEID